MENHTPEGVRAASKLRKDESEGETLASEDDTFKGRRSTTSGAELSTKFQHEGV
jgi:hypothetical protein